MKSYSGTIYDAREARARRKAGLPKHGFGASYQMKNPETLELYWQAEQDIDMARCLSMTVGTGLYRYFPYSAEEWLDGRPWVILNSGEDY